MSACILPTQEGKASSLSRSLAPGAPLTAARRAASYRAHTFEMSASEGDVPDSGSAAADAAATDAASAASAADAATATDAAAPLAAAELSSATLLLSLLVPLLIAIFVFCRGSSAGGGRKLVLFGPIGAGKSAIFHQLRYGRVVPTVSSMTLDEATIVPAGADGASAGKPAKIVVVPGTGRLRAQLIEEASSAGALVCVLGHFLGPFIALGDLGDLASFGKPLTATSSARALRLQLQSAPATKSS